MSESGGLRPEPDGYPIKLVRDQTPNIIALAEHHGVTLGYLIRKAHDDPRGGFKSGMMMYGRHPEYDR